MKHFIFYFLVAFSVDLSSQITLNHDHPEARYLTKLDHNGYVHYSIDAVNGTIEIFDLNNVLLNSILIPNYSTIQNLPEIYLSDNLFDTDTQIEFLLFRQTNNNKLNLEIYNESGTLIFSRDWVGFQSFITGPLHIDVLRNDRLIFYDGVSTKMRFFKYTSNTTGQYEVYDLPGSLPCVSCVVEPGSPNAVKSNGIRKADGTNFYPNPVSIGDGLKLNYKIPSTSKIAKIKVYNAEGKMIDEKRISSSTDYILLPSDYNNGLYVYSLEVDNTVIKTEKIILNK